MAIFGTTSNAGANLTIEDRVVGGIFQVTETGSANSITAYLDYSGIGPSKVKYALYEWNYPSAKCGDFIAETTQGNKQVGPNSDEWRTLAFPTGDGLPSLEKDKYYAICAFANKIIFVETQARVVIDTSAYVTVEDTLYSSGYPSTLDGSLDLDNYRMAVYCTYTPCTVLTPPLPEPDEREELEFQIKKLKKQLANL